MSNESVKSKNKSRLKFQSYRGQMIKNFDHDREQNPNFPWSKHPFDNDHKENSGVSVAMVKPSQFFDH